MKKTIHIDENHSIELDGTLGWLLLYRAQFGRDILPELMPVLEALVEIITATEIDTVDDYNTVNIIKNIGESDLGNAFATLSTLELTTLIQIIWALAKQADKSIGDPYDWVSQFEVFPIDEILPGAIKVIVESSATPKNSTRLLKILTKLK